MLVRESVSVSSSRALTLADQQLSADSGAQAAINASHYGRSQQHVKLQDFKTKSVKFSGTANMVQQTDPAVHGDRKIHILRRFVFLINDVN